MRHPVKLCPEHLKNARLFADRHHMVPELGIAQGGAIAEIGVFRGDFTAFLVDTLKPRTVAAFDLFDQCTETVMWGRPMTEWFDNKAPKQFVRDRFSAYPDMSLILFEGKTTETLPQAPDAAFDLVYVDAGHVYEDVIHDAWHAVRMAKPDGVVIFNDYMMVDHAYSTPYGVVQAANEIVTTTDWRVIGFALNSHMYCDLAISRR